MPKKVLELLEIGIETEKRAHNEFMKLIRKQNEIGSWKFIILLRLSVDLFRFISFQNIFVGELKKKKKKNVIDC